MNTDDMATILRVAQTGSMSLAARQLHLTPAAVSAAVKRVEERLGVRVFERTTRTVSPTEEGLMVLAGCEEILARWQQTLDGAREARGELDGSVHISAPADTTYQLVAPVVVAMSAAHPRLQIVVHSSDTVQHLHRDAIDMAIRYGPLQDSGLSVRKLATWPIILIAAPSYLAQFGQPQRLAELDVHRLITLQLSHSPHTTWQLRGDDGDTHEVSLRSPLCGDGHLARQWAIDGEGIAMKCLFDVIDDLLAGRLVRVLPGYVLGECTIHAIFPSRAYTPARVRALDAALTAAFDERSARCHAWMTAGAASGVDSSAREA